MPVCQGVSTPHRLALLKVLSPTRGYAEAVVLQTSNASNKTRAATGVSVDTRAPPSQVVPVCQGVAKTPRLAQPAASNRLERQESRVEGLKAKFEPLLT